MTPNRNLTLMLLFAKHLILQQHLVQSCARTPASARSTPGLLLQLQSL